MVHSEDEEMRRLGVTMVRELFTEKDCKEIFSPVNLDIAMFGVIYSEYKLFGYTYICFYGHHLFGNSDKQIYYRKITLPHPMHNNER